VLRFGAQGFLYDKISGSAENFKRLLALLKKHELRAKSAHADKFTKTRLYQSFSFFLPIKTKGLLVL